MADIAPFLWLVAPNYMDVEGTVDVEGDYVHVVASFSWTSLLPSVNGGAGVDAIWVALPRDQYDAADTLVYGGFPPSAGLYGEYNWDYIDEEFEPYDPFIGYVGRLTINGNDHVMSLIRGDCYLFLTLRDFFPGGIEASGDVDIKWKNGPGTQIDPRTAAEPGSANASSDLTGVVRTHVRRPTGSVRRSP